MRPQVANPDAAVARIAAKQHGVVTFTQLINAGLSPSQVRNRVRSGRLHRIHRGVYAVGHRGFSNEGTWMAAVLACGEGAVLSHRSAAALWRMLPPRKEPPHVTIPTGAGRRRRPEIRIHRSPSLTRAAAAVEDGIPVTIPARTLADLRRSFPADQVRRAIRQAEFLGLDLGDTPTDHTRSEPESAFLRLCRRDRIPEPEANVRIGRFTVDFLWRRQRLVVEIDSYAAHRGKQAFEDDHQRELELHAHGYRLRRFTDVQVYGRPHAVAATVVAALREVPELKA